jgi:hypothetical protein
MIWKSAKNWAYVTHEPFDELVIPKRKQPESRIFSLEEIQKILLHASNEQMISRDERARLIKNFRSFRISGLEAGCG